MATATALNQVLTPTQQVGRSFTGSNKGVREMSLLKNLFYRAHGAPSASLRPFDAQDMKIEWRKGNNLRITFLTSCYMSGGDTIEINAPIVIDDITPGVIYDAGIKKELEK